jgi:autotransporter-associated beta strand protein
MSGQRTTFWQGDLVRFDDTGAAGTVELTSAVSPGAVVVDNAAVSYVLNGSGSLTGAMTLTKRGAGMLTLATANAYTGDTQILGGTVIAAAGYALGSGPSTVRLGATSGSDSAALLVSGAVVVDRPIVVQGDGSGTSTRTLGGTHTAGAAVFSGGVTVLADLTLVAAEGGEVDLTGPLDDLAGKAIAKTGAGVLVLGGTQSYGLGAVLNVEEGAIFMSTDGGAEATADLAVNVGGAGTDAAITFGSDQHLAMLHIMAGGVARLGDGCRVLELDSLWIDAFGPPLTNIRLVNAPEPATLALLGLGGAALLVRRFGRGRVRFPAIR